MSNIHYIFSLLVKYIYYSVSKITAGLEITCHCIFKSTVYALNFCSFRSAFLLLIWCTEVSSLLHFCLHKHMVVVFWDYEELSLKTLDYFVYFSDISELLRVHGLSLSYRWGSWWGNFRHLGVRWSGDRTRVIAPAFGELLWASVSRVEGTLFLESVEHLAVLSSAP